MQVIVQGNKITLTQKDYVTQGGEGKIFQKGAVAYKIYEDLSKMIALGKIEELGKLDSPLIVRPKDVIYSSKKEILGFTMDWLGDDNFAMCKMFTNTFRDTHNITYEQAIELVDNIKIVLMGVSYKANTDDTRNTPTENIVKILMNRYHSHNIVYIAHDPYVKEKDYQLTKLTDNL